MTANTKHTQVDSQNEILPNAKNVILQMLDKLEVIHQPVNHWTGNINPSGHKVYTIHKEFN